MKLSNSIKKRFVKDYSLPINIFSEPFFMNSINTLDISFESIKKFNYFTDLLKKYENEEEFFQENNKLIKNVRKILKENNLSYEKLNQNKLEEKTKFIQTMKSKFEFKKNLYNENNVNKNFISIDLKQANFHCLKFMGVIPEKYNTYEDLIKSENNENYFVKSKYIRQVIFGDILPKKNKIISEFVVANILNKVKKIIEPFKNDIILIFNTDELIIEIPENLSTLEEKSFISEFLLLFPIKVKETNIVINKFNFPLHFDLFSLKGIRDKKDKIHFIKEYKDGKKEIKGTHSLFYLQIFKYINNLKIEEEDLKFYYEGMLAKFDESII